jgi:two-component system, NarL family, sensor histidine kinase UhpB
MKRLPAAARLHLWVCAAFALVLLVTLGVLLRQAEKDVVRELEGARSLALQLFDGLSRRGELYSPETFDTVRHVRVARPDSPPVALAVETVPYWLSRRMQPVIERHFPPVYLTFNDGERWVVSPDPQDELEEVWESVVLLLTVFAIALMLSLLVIQLALRRGLRAYQQLLAGLQQIGTGDLDARLMPSQQPELNQLSERFNSMARALQRAEASNRQLTHALMNLQERERTDLAHTLHDDLGQYLTGIRAQAFMLREAADRPEHVRDHAGRLLQACDGLQQGFRRLVRTLHPVVLERLGLEQALRQLTEQWQLHQGIVCHLEVDEELPELPGQARTHLYRLLQEALNNAARHAQASAVWVRLVRQGDVLLVSVQDNGRGMIAEPEAGFGLRSMQERARCLNAALRIITRPGEGLRLNLDVPIRALA